MKIAVAGAGYVGLSLAVLLAQDNEVVILEINQDKVNAIFEYKSPIKDEYIEKYLAEAKIGKRKLNLRATTDYKDAMGEADFVIIATPTDYDERTNTFDTSAVEDVIEKVLQMENKDTVIVIKSTVPVGYIKSVRKKYGIRKIFFSPEFLREGKALYDNLHPARIIVGAKMPCAYKFAELLKDAALDKDVPVLFMGSLEAESVKLFANTYLALRVAYFNELDTFAHANDLSSEDIIDGICLDPRIGNYYNNPSFGYGGYCLPKDTKQLLATYKDVPQSLIGAVIDSNRCRKKYIVQDILSKKPETVGVYRLIMKSGSDNFRAAAIKDIVNILREKDAEIIIYEPTISSDYFDGLKIVNDFDEFAQRSTIVLANRIDEKIETVFDKVYTRDLFKID